MISAISSALPFLLDGLWMTFKISLATIFFGSLLGAMVGTVRASPLRSLSFVLGLYIHALRGTPFLIHLYAVYFMLPATGVAWLQFDAITASIIALSLYTSTYVAEVVRAALEAVPRGQVEAARSVGMSTLQTLRHVVVPQALKLMIPPMGGVYVIIIKGTSIVSVVGVSELVRAGEQAAQRDPSHMLVIYGLVALMYLAYCYPVLRIVRWLETRFGAGVTINI
ncbi:amino acid ABC transporter permease [Roseovarius sp. CAU 1744]|uniref:amino acid ABC transporter permease n=1 Tax=Roseovarius sp. CAU 1744 TaxID=3140368 RepID=UPI00325B1FAC